MRWPWRSRRRTAPAPAESPGAVEPHDPAEQTSDSGPDAGNQPTGATPNHVIVYLHIPKCGGTSLHDWLGRVLAPGVLSPERNRMPAELPAEKLASFEEHRVFSGHFDVIDLTNLPGPQRRFTVLRDPVERIVSLYDFWRAHSDEFVDEHDLVGPRVARMRTFEDFIGDVDPRVIPDLDNTMVRTFTGLIRSAEPFADPDRSLAEAVEFVGTLDHVGHVDDLDATVAWLCGELDIDVASAGELGRSNVRGTWDEPFLDNVERTVVSPDAEAAIEPLVALDRELIARFSR